MLHQEIVKDLKIFVDKIMKDEGISQYEYHIEGQTENGINYGGEIVFFSVTPKTGGKKYDLVMKTSRRSEDTRKALGDGVLDIRETHVYSKVFPALRQLLAEYKSEYQLENVAKTLLINTEFQHETMIMGDLRKEGYRLWNKRKPMNLEHIKTVLSYYGKYHASTMALRVRKPEVFQELTRDMESIYKHYLNDDQERDFFRHYTEDAMKVLREFGLDNIVEKLKELTGNTLETLSQVEVEDRVVITHGDCWINNLMFKYQTPESLEPLGVCFLDFQLSALGSPASDLSYYLYTSCDEDTITNQFDELLRYYFESLASTLRNLGLEPDEIFTYQMLREHWKKYAVTGLIMSSVIIKIQLTNTEEAPSFSGGGNAPDLLTSLKIGDIEDNEVYKSRIVAVYKNYAKTCL